MDFEQVMNMLFQMFGGTGSRYQRVPYQGGLPYHVSQSYSHNEGMMEGLLKSFFPFLNRQQQAPWFTTQRDFSQIMQRTQDLQNLQKTYTMQNIPSIPREFANLPYYQNDQRMMGVLGKLFSAAGMERDTQAGIFGSLPYQLFSNIAGGMLFGQGPQAREAGVMQDLTRYFGGTPTRARAGGMMSGLPVEAVRDITGGLFQTSYQDQDGMFKKTPFFELEDMADIMRMGIDTGMEMPLNKAGQVDTDRLMRNTQNLAKVIQAGMTVFQTMDKEEVLQNIMELTRGKVAIADTAQMENILHRVNAVAKSINLNTKFMQKMAAEGSALFEQLNLPPQAGALITSEIVAINKGLTTGPGRLFTPQEAAELGGPSAMRKELVGQAAQMYTSPAWRTVSLASEARKLGMINAEQFGRTEAAYSGGKLIESNETVQLRENLIQQKMIELRNANPNLSQSVIRTAAVDEVDKMEKSGVSRRTMDIGTGKTSFYQDYESHWKNRIRELGFDIQGPEMDRLMNDLTGPDKSKRQNAINVMSSQIRMYGKVKGLTPEEVERNLIMPMRILGRTPEQRRIDEEMRLFRRGEELAERAAQETFVPQGVLDIFKKTVFDMPGGAGTMMDAFFKTFKPEATKLFTTAQLQTEFSPLYQQQLRELSSPEKVSELAGMFMEYYSPSSGPLKKYLDIASQITGKTYMPRGQIRTLLESESENRRMTEGQRTDTFNKSMEYIKTTFGISDINLDDLKKEMEAGKGTFSTYANYFYGKAKKNHNDLVVSNALNNTKLLGGYMSYLSANKGEQFAGVLLDQMSGLQELVSGEAGVAGKAFSQVFGDIKGQYGAGAMSDLMKDFQLLNVDMSHDIKMRQFNESKSALTQEFALNDITLENIKDEFTNKNLTYQSFADFLQKKSKKTGINMGDIVSNKNISKMFISYMNMTKDDEQTANAITAINRVQNSWDYANDKIGSILSLSDEQVFGKDYNTKKNALEKKLMGRESEMTDEERKIVDGLPNQNEFLKAIKTLNVEIQNRVKSATDTELDSATDRLFTDKKSMFEVIKKSRDNQSKEFDKVTFAKNLITEMGWTTQEQIVSGMDTLTKIATSDKKEDVRDMISNFVRLTKPTEEESKKLDVLESQWRAANNKADQDKIAGQITDQKYQIARRGVADPEELKKLESFESQIDKMRKEGRPAEEVQKVMSQRDQAMNDIMIRKYKTLSAISGVAPAILGLSPEEIISGASESKIKIAPETLKKELTDLQEKLFEEERKILVSPSEELAKSANNMAANTEKVSKSIDNLDGTIKGVMTFIKGLFGYKTNTASVKETKVDTARPTEDK